MFLEPIVAVLTYTIAVTTTVYNDPNVAIPIAETWAIYMTPECGLLKENLQPMPLPLPHYAIAPCPYTQENRHKKLAPCVPIHHGGKLCWTNKVEPAVKVICPECMYGLVYYHNFEPDAFKFGLMAFPSVNNKECNHRNFRRNLKSYTPAKKTKIDLSKYPKSQPKARPGNHKQTYR